MSLDAYILFNKNISTIAEWQSGLDALDLPLVLTSDKSLPSLHGHLPARWKNREAGFECSLGEAGELIELYHDVDFGGPWQWAMELHYSPFAGCVGAIMAAAALAHLTEGIVYDPQEGRVFDAAAAAEYAREMAIAIPRLEASFERGELKTR